jgi:transglutaminase-like putative cysteine protease
VSVGGIAVPLPRREAKQAPRGKHPLLELFERFSPSQGWATFLLLIATLLVVGNSVTTAGWVDTPGLGAVLFFGALTGLLLAKVRAHAILLHIAGILVGAVVVVWKASSLAGNTPLADQLAQMWDRLNVWYTAAVSDGISTDLLPFSMALMSFSWLISYFSAWFIFRRSNVWAAVVLGGVGILTNLSFLPPEFESSARFFLFVFLAMLLVVRLSIVQRHEQWRKAGIEYSPLSGWLTMHAVLWFSIGVVALAAWLPLNVVVSRPLANVWKAGRAPINNLEDDFARLFSGIPSKKNLSGRFFGTTLPFLGKISFGGEVVFWANTDYPSYWLSRTYDEYTSQGWRTGATREVEIGPELQPPPRVDTLKRTQVNQSLQLSFGTSNFLAGGSLEWISRSGELEILAPKQFEIGLRDSSKDGALPADVQELARELREDLATPPDRFIESYITRILPEDMVLVRLNTVQIPGSQRPALDSVVLERKEPIAPEIVSWKFSEPLEENEAYGMVSFVSLATDEELRQAGDDYSGFIKDYYLQLPSTLPQRVRDLAAQITRDAPTPFDKALAIQSYLRGKDNFTYSQDIQKPPAGADGVDYFLFETRTGYSDYFASSMTVLLRAVGVPARMAAGYAPGEYDEQNDLRVIRDSDSHGWVQVYFPRYGWIDFEPTPAWPIHQRELTPDPASELTPDRLTDGSSPSEEDLFGPFDEEVNPFVGLPVNIPGQSFNPMRVVIPAGIALGALAALWLLFQLVWAATLIGATPVERAYAKMSRLGMMAGFKRRTYQTPLEYAAVLGNAVPAAAPGTQRIAQAFASDRYGRRELTGEQHKELETAWKSIRGSLILQSLRRLIPRPHLSTDSSGTPQPVASSRRTSRRMRR